jgi:hypothetical protein
MNSTLGHPMISFITPTHCRLKSNVSNISPISVRQVYCIGVTRRFNVSEVGVSDDSGGRTLSPDSDGGRCV